MRPVAALALAFLFGVAAAPAQSTSASPLKVKVMDQSPAAIPHATVAIISMFPAASPTEGLLELMTGDSGIVTAKLKPGAYKVIVSASGFRTVRKQVTVPRATPLEVTLDIPRYSGPVFVIRTYNPALSPESVPLHQLIPDLP
jgi:hypothetical protein